MAPFFARFKGLFTLLAFGMSMMFSPAVAQDTPGDTRDTESYWERWGPVFSPAFYMGAPGELKLVMTAEGQALLALHCIGEELSAEDGPLSCIYRSGEDGSAWSLWWAGEDRVRAMTGGDPAFVLSAEGLYRSRDSGATWTELPLELPAPDVREDFRALLQQADVPSDEFERAVAFMEEGPKTVSDFADLQGFGVASVLALNQTPAGDLLLATPDGVFLSSDDGDSWELLLAPVHSGTLLEIGEIIAPAAQEILLSGRDVTTDAPFILRTTDAGGDWQTVRSTPEGDWPIIRTPDGTYVTERAVSPDLGITWEQVPPDERSVVTSLLTCCQPAFMSGDALWIPTATGPQMLGHAGNDWRALRQLPPGWLATGVMVPDGRLVVAIYDPEESAISLWRGGEASERR